jgi:hypothetical protein
MAFACDVEKAHISWQMNDLQRPMKKETTSVTTSTSGENGTYQMCTCYRDVSLNVVLNDKKLI